MFSRAGLATSIHSKAQVGIELTNLSLGVNHYIKHISLCTLQGSWELETYQASTYEHTTGWELKTYRPSIYTQKFGSWRHTHTHTLALLAMT